MALSATLPPAVHAHVVNGIRLKEPCSIKASIQRFNIRSFVVPIKQRQTLDLNILIPDNPLEPIPVTLLYVDNINMGIDIVEQLRNRFPEGLRKHRSEVIRVFTGDLDAEAREVFIEDLRSGKTRIMVCTEACGLGVDLHNIVRVVQWQISELLTSSRLIQRFGRAGRDPKVQAISLLFVQKQYFLTPSGQASSENQSESSLEQQASNSAPQKSPPNNCNLEEYTRFTTAVTTESENLVREMMKTLYYHSGSSDTSGQPEKGWRRMDPGLIWYINTVGCRQ